MKVLIIIITKDYVQEECLNSVINQDYDNYSWMISGMKPIYDDESYVVRLYKNCSANREYSRKMALASDADYFLFIDSDIVLPLDAISNFILQVDKSKKPKIKIPPNIKSFNDEKHIIGGWYKMINCDKWVSGHWVDDNVFLNCSVPEVSLIKVDMVGLGCAFISRQALSDLSFGHGTDIISKDPHGNNLVVGECGLFGNIAAEKGYDLYMDGSVICKHLYRADLPSVV